jgi:hypothetical protein
MGKQRTQKSGIYTAQDYEILKRERRRLNDMIGLMDRAEACGVSCDTFRAMRDSLDQQLAAIEVNFMTPAPA